MVAPLADILATGVRTPLGLRSAPSAAAMRAAISRLGEHPALLDRLGNPVPACLDPLLEAGVPMPDRLVAMAQHALLEIGESLADRRPSPSVPVFLALPEIRPGFTAQQAAYVRDRLATAQGLAFAIPSVQVYPRGHAGAGVALDDAIALLARGGHEMAIVGGVESYFDPETLRWLDQHRQLAGEDGRSSFVPGEGAGLLLIASPRTRGSSRVAPAGSIVAVGRGQERSLIKTRDLCLGEGLVAAVSSALQGLGRGQRVSRVICDINGERYRSEEWGFVALKLGARFDDLLYVCPASSWGDMGAASIPLFVMLACQAAARGYAPGPRTLVWASSEQGTRGAVLVEADGARGG
jgi:3-oxoacyl-[acyl-carrier-protein] synthase-1